MKIIIVVPLYNEGQRVVDTVLSILKNSKSAIVCVDDGSKDESYDLLKKSFIANKKVFVIRHIINLGKGAAMKTGAEMAWKLGAEAVIFVDADGQHNPEHLPDFEKALKSHKIVFGYRIMRNMPLVRKWGNLMANKIIKYFFRINRKDLLCGFLGFNKSEYDKLLWKSPRYGVETEMATKVGKNNLDFFEIKVDTIYIDKYKGVSILDALKILFHIPFWYFSK